MFSTTMLRIEEFYARNCFDPFFLGEATSGTEGLTCIASIPTQRFLKPSYYHSFAVTENYFVFIEQPCVFDLKKLPYIIYMRKPISTVFNICPNDKTRFHIIEKSSGKLLGTKYVGDFLFTFHQINAYEEDGQIVLDFVASTNGCNVSLTNTS